MEADSERPVDFEHMDTSSRPQQSRAVEGHSLMTRLNGHYDAIQEEAAQRSVHPWYNGLHNTMFKHEHHTHCTVHIYIPGSIHTPVQYHLLA